jgi:hypothetical protein
MKAAPIHAFEHDQMSARIGNRNRDRDPGLPGFADGRVGYFFRPGMGQAFCVGDEHEDLSREESSGAGILPRGTRSIKALLEGC